MSSEMQYSIATGADAPWIASMSRDLIESELGWSWNRDRVMGAIRDPDTIVLKARRHQRAVAFAILGVGSDEAHLLLLAVAQDRRRLGIGSRLVGWLEESALIAGVGIVRLEVRASRVPERRFYQSLGYRSVAMSPGYYDGREAAVRMAKDLWERRHTPTDR